MQAGNLNPCLLLVDSCASQCNQIQRCTLFIVGEPSRSAVSVSKKQMNSFNLTSLYTVSRFPMVSLDTIHWHNPSGRTMPGVDSVSNKNEYQKYFLGGKGGRCVGLTTHVPTVLKSGSLNLLEPSRPVQACLGTALHQYSQGCFIVSLVFKNKTLLAFDLRWNH